MPKTRRGIYHDLRESTYTAFNNGAVFFFSSKLYREKFLNQYKNYRDRHIRTIQEILPEMGRYYRDRLYLYYDIQLYDEIEKRGFRCLYEGTEFSCRENFQKFALQRTINTNIEDWSETHGRK